MNNNGYYGHNYRDEGRRRNDNFLGYENVHVSFRNEQWNGGGNGREESYESIESLKEKVNLFEEENESLKSQISRMKTDYEMDVVHNVNILQQKNDELQEENENLQSENMMMKTDYERDVVHNIDILQQKNEEMKNEIDYLQSQIVVMKNKENEKTEELSRYIEENESLRSNIRIIEADYEQDIVHNVNILQEKNNRIEEENQFLQEKVMMMKLERDLAQNLFKSHQESEKLGKFLSNLRGEKDGEKLEKPIFFSFFEEGNSLESISNLEDLERHLKKNEENIQSANQRILRANERIRNRISKIKLETLAKKESTNKESHNDCKICFEKKINTSLDPCGHTLCQECAQKLSDCPFCREKIKRRMKVFL